MKGSEKVLAVLNTLLADELTAVNQYIVHSEMCENWGYEKLHDIVQKRAIQEMEHAEKIIARILFLEGKPIVSRLNNIHIGVDIPAQLQNDLEAEIEADKSYNNAINIAMQESDNASRVIFESILKDEEDHIDWIEAQLDQVKQMGLSSYLVEQVG